MIVLYILGALLAVLLIYILFLGILALAVNPHRLYETHSPFYRFVLGGATAAGMKLLRIKIHVTGMEKVPRCQNLLFVSNHCSKFDPLVTWLVFRDWNIAFVSKPENFKIPFFGRIIRRCCFLPIDREDPRKAMDTINRAAGLLQNTPMSVGVYPEGKRSKDGVLLPFHNGVFKIAQKANTPVVVLTVCGTERIAKRTPFRHTDVYLNVEDVIFGRIKETRTVSAQARRLMEARRENDG